MKYFIHHGLVSRMQECRQLAHCRIEKGINRNHNGTIVSHATSC
nr:MAG TPA: hypothetical protein [Crassvirales sp.]